MPKRKLIDIFKQINRNGPIHPTNPELDLCWMYTGYYNEKRRMPEWSFEGEKLIPYRVVWELIKGESWPDGTIAVHSCDRRMCCNVMHFVPGSIADNNADKELRGQAGGMSHRDVRIVRFLLGMAIARSAIAMLMECSVSTINAIASGQNHKRTEDVNETELLQDGETESGPQSSRGLESIQQQSTEAEDEHSRSKETSVQGDTNTLDTEGDTT